MAISTGSDIKFIKAPSKYAFLNDKNSIATYGKNSVVFFQDTNEIFLDNKLYSSKIYPNLYTGGDMSINEAWRVVDFSTQHGLAIIQDLFDPIPHIIYQASSNLINTNIFLINTNDIFRISGYVSLHNASIFGIYMLFNGCVICNNYYQSVLTLNATHFIGGSIPEIIVDNNYTYFEFYIQSPISLQGTISIGCNKTNAIKLRSICCNRIASIAEDTFPDITSENTWKPYTPLI